MNSAKVLAVFWTFLGFIYHMRPAPLKTNQKEKKK